MDDENEQNDQGGSVFDQIDDISELSTNPDARDDQPDTEPDPSREEEEEQDGDSQDREPIHYRREEEEEFQEEEDEDQDSRQADEEDEGLLPEEISLRDLEQFRSNVANHPSFDEEDLRQIDDAIDKWKPKAEQARKDADRIEAFEQQIRWMQDNVEARRALLEQAADRLDFKNDFRALGQFFLQKQKKLRDACQKLIQD